MAMPCKIIDYHSLCLWPTRKRLNDNTNVFQLSLEVPSMVNSLSSFDLRIASLHFYLMSYSALLESYRFHHRSRRAFQSGGNVIQHPNSNESEWVMTHETIFALSIPTSLACRGQGRRRGGLNALQIFYVRHFTDSAIGYDDERGEWEGGGGVDGDTEGERVSS